MKDFASFLNPTRKPNAIVKLSSFDEPFELKIVSREDEAEMASSRYKEIPASERLGLYVAYGMVCPDLRDKGLLDALRERDGKTYLDPLETLYALFDVNEISTLFAEYSKLADLTENFNEKTETAKN